MIIYGHCIVIYGYMWLVMANHDNRYQQFKMVSSAYIKSDIVYIYIYHSEWLIIIGYNRFKWLIVDKHGVYIDILSDC